MEINLNREFNKIINDINLNDKPNLFLHVCCGPCSTSVIKKINKYFNIYAIFMNSNIDTIYEFDKRLDEFKKVIKINNYNIDIIFDEYNHNDFINYVKGLENEIEGGKRCEMCFKLRLNKSFQVASEFVANHNLNNNYLCSTLSVSPHKNAHQIYKIGEEICSKSNGIIRYLPSDFKKENGYLDSIKLSKEYGLYRQNYCGCEYSKCIK